MCVYLGVMCVSLSLWLCVYTYIRTYVHIAYTYTYAPIHSPTPRAPPPARRNARPSSSRMSNVVCRTDLPVELLSHGPVCATYVM